MFTPALNLDPLEQKINSESDGWVRIVENFRWQLNCYEEKSSQCSNLSLLQLPQSPDGGSDAGRGHSGVVIGSSSNVDPAVLVVTEPHSNSLDKEILVSYCTTLPCLVDIFKAMYTRIVQL